MFRMRRAADRGHADHGWLDARHTFSFADYLDPNQMGFRALRVINEDRVAPGMGFGMHGHRDMEIVTYVLEGALAHRDSMGNGAVLRPGEFQHMTAGTGVRHSEVNASKTDPVHLYQIWLLPERAGLTPSYAQKTFGEEQKRGRFLLAASPDGADGSLSIRQDARIYLATLESGQEIAHPLGSGRHGWLQVLRGSVRVGEMQLDAGDGLAASDEPNLAVAGVEPAELMLFDLP